MKKKSLIIVLVATCLTAVLLGLLVMLPLTGCNGVPCCPYIIDFRADPKVICKTGCLDDGGQVFLYGTVAYHKDKEPCSPAGGTKIEVQNKSTNSLVPNINLKATQVPGIYETTVSIKNLNENTKFQLKAFGEEGCPAQSRETDEIIVLENEYLHELCTSSGDLHGNCTWEIRNDYFGKGIVIEEIRYPQRNEATGKNNTYSITVTYKNRSISMKPGSTSRALRGMTPGDNWTIQINTVEECKKFKAAPEDLCVILVLRCECDT